MDGASTHQELDQAFARTVELDDARDVRPSVRRRASRRRYERSEKGRARSRRYDMTWKGCQRHRRYDRTANGRRRKIDYDVQRGRDLYLQQSALAERQAYEASGSSLSFVDWLNEVDPLPKLRLPLEGGHSLMAAMPTTARISPTDTPQAWRAAEDAFLSVLRGRDAGLDWNIRRGSGGAVEPVSRCCASSRWRARSWSSRCAWTASATGESPSKADRTSCPT